MITPLPLLPLETISLRSCTYGKKIENKGINGKNSAVKNI
jgi:hypothetical protein